MNVSRRDTLEFDFQSFLQASHEFLRVANEYEAMGHPKLEGTLPVGKKFLD